MMSQSTPRAARREGCVAPPTQGALRGGGSGIVCGGLPVANHCLRHECFNAIRPYPINYMFLGQVGVSDRVGR